MTPEFLAALAPEQTAKRRDEPYPRKKLGFLTAALLWALRLYVFIAVPLVIYAFARAVMQPT
ncbi:MAG TPA: hypothetical protein VEQ16_06345 [Acidocella sp.]|nr:hypothetical protein [Acidocella sp.]